MRFLVFGGTTEGRELVSWLSARGCEVVAYSATEYGGSLLEEGPLVDSRVGPLAPDEMGRLMRGGGFACVIDATHPYAVQITGHVAGSARAAGLARIRLVREGEPEGPWTHARDAAEAAEIVAGLAGNALLTTGSKDLATFTGAVDGFRERLYVRVLPVVSSIERTRDLGIPASHVIAMQGPFSQELNVALVHELGIRVLVTKASGKAGGFWEKVGAARECGIECIVIGRPVEEEGLTLEETKGELEARYGI